MIPVYVINLARSPERRAFMAEGLARAGVVPEFVAAVDGRACRSTRSPRAALSRGETALILSHRKAWRRLLRSASDYAAVLEDDAHVGENFEALLAADWSGLDFDAVKLETMFDRVWTARRHRVIGERSLHRLGAEHHGTAGYLVSRAGARKFLALTRRLAEPVDQTMFGRTPVFDRRVSIYQLVPAVIVQDHLLPDVAARRQIDTTLHEQDRKLLTAATRAARPRGLKRLARETWRIVDQARRVLRLWPWMRRGRVPFR